MRARLTAVIQRYPLVTYFVLAYGISWILWSPLIAASQGLLPFEKLPLSLTIVVGAGNYGPALSAIILTAILHGKAGLREFLGRLLQWRVGILWYGFILLWPAARNLLAIGIYVLLGGTAPEFTNLGQWYFAFAVLLATFFQTGLAEEIGWRGFALPRLQVRHNALIASLILGILWTFWHLPAFLDPHHTLAGLPIIWYLIGTVALTTVFTWVYNNTGGSLLMAALFHAAINTATWLVPYLPSVGAPDTTIFILTTVLNWLTVLLLIAIFGAKRLSRKSETSTPPTNVT